MLMTRTAPIRICEAYLAHKSTKELGQIAEQHGIEGWKKKRKKEDLKAFLLEEAKKTANPSPTPARSRTSPSPSASTRSATAGTKRRRKRSSTIIASATVSTSSFRPTKECSSGSTNSKQSASTTRSSARADPRSPLFKPGMVISLISDGSEDEMPAATRPRRNARPLRPEPAREMSLLDEDEGDAQMDSGAYDPAADVVQFYSVDDFSVEDTDADFSRREPAGNTSTTSPPSLASTAFAPSSGTPAISDAVHYTIGSTERSSAEFSRTKPASKPSTTSLPSLTSAASTPSPLTPTTPDTPAAPYTGISTEHPSVPRTPYTATESTAYSTPKDDEEDETGDQLVWSDEDPQSVPAFLAKKRKAAEARKKRQQKNKPKRQPERGWRAEPGPLERFASLLSSDDEAEDSMEPAARPRWRHC